MNIAHTLGGPHSDRLHSCLKSLRQHICPLCRSPFEASELRRLHVDSGDPQLLDARRTPSPSRMGEKRLELPADNALGLVDDIPRATELQRKISDLVLRSSFTNGVRERGVRELIHEIHAFLNTEPRDMVCSAVFHLSLMFKLITRFPAAHRSSSLIPTPLPIHRASGEVSTARVQCLRSSDRKPPVQTNDN